MTPEAAEAIDRLIRHGVVVQNQTVLLKGINDDDATMRALLRKLLMIPCAPVLPLSLRQRDGRQPFQHDD